MDDADSRVARSVSTAHRLELRVTADPFWMSPLRALVADLAARAEFDIDRVSDLTLAMDEACAMVIRLLEPDEVLVCRLVATADGIEITVGGPTARWPEPGALATAFGWQVITAIADEAEPVRTADLSFGVRMSMARSHEWDRE